MISPVMKRFELYFLQPENQNFRSIWLSSFQLLYQKYHRLGGLKNKHLLLIVLETGKSEIQVPVDLLSGETCFLVHRWSVFYFVISWHRIKELPRVQFIRLLILFMRNMTHDLITFQGSISKCHHIRDCISVCEFRKDRNIQSIPVFFKCVLFKNYAYSEIICQFQA